MQRKERTRKEKKTVKRKLRLLRLAETSENMTIYEVNDKMNKEGMEMKIVLKNGDYSGSNNGDNGEYQC
jgi:hypothetical protein